jgi:hypothetical protein
MNSPDSGTAFDAAIPTRAARWGANLLELWRYCTQATCRRAHRCRGDGRRCIRRHTHRVPSQFYRGAKAIVEAHAVRQQYAERMRASSPPP